MEGRTPRAAKLVRSEPWPDLKKRTMRTREGSSASDNEMYPSCTPPAAKCSSASTLAHATARTPRRAGRGSNVAHAREKWAESSPPELGRREPERGPRDHLPCGGRAGLAIAACAPGASLDRAVAFVTLGQAAPKQRTLHKSQVSWHRRDIRNVALDTSSRGRAGTRRRAPPGHRSVRRHRRLDGARREAGAGRGEGARRRVRDDDEPRRRGVRRHGAGLRRRRDLRLLRRPGRA